MPDYLRPEDVPEDVRNASLAMLKLMDLAEEAIANHKPEQATEGAA